MRYEDFNLRITADGDGWWETAESPSGKATEPLVSVPSLLAGLAGTGDLAAVLTRDLRPASGMTVPSLKTLGGLLFRTVFHGSVRQLFDRSLGDLQARADWGLRLRIHLDPSDARLRSLIGLPWELLYCETLDEFLNLNRRTPVVRSLDVLRPVRSLPTGTPLRVLMILANPVGTSPLDLSAEKRGIEEACAGLETVEIHFLEHATRDALRRRIREQAFDIVHFMGHGGFDVETRSGALLLGSGTAGIDFLTDKIFASFFKGLLPPMLVVLNACHTARSTGTADLDPFAGLAASLVLEGLPAVLAMRTAVRDRAAVAFGEELYRRLAKGDPIEAAVTEARLALLSNHPDAADWSIPVLFLRPAAADQPQPESHKTPEPVAAEAAPRKVVSPASPDATTFHMNLKIGRVESQNVVQANNVSIGNAPTPSGGADH